MTRVRASACFARWRGLRDDRYVPTSRGQRRRAARRARRVRGRTRRVPSAASSPRSVSTAARCPRAPQVGDAVRASVWRASTSSRGPPGRCRASLRAEVHRHGDHPCLRPVVRCARYGAARSPGTTAAARRCDRRCRALASRAEVRRAVACSGARLRSRRSRCEDGLGGPAEHLGPGVEFPERPVGWAPGGATSRAAGSGATRLGPRAA